MASVSRCCKERPEVSVYVRFKAARGRLVGLRRSSSVVVRDNWNGPGSRFSLPGEMTASLRVSDRSPIDIVSSLGLSTRSSLGRTKLFSKTLSLTKCAGPVRGPWSSPRPAELMASGLIIFAFWRSSIILSNSSSPAKRACALAMRGDEAAQPNLSRMNSMLRLSTCCRFCKVSLLWCAKEKECRDSEGKRVRSSPNGIAGEPGPEGRLREAFRELAADDEADRNSKAGSLGSEGSRAVLMRRSPVSRSAVSMGDLFVATCTSAIVTCMPGAGDHATVRRWLVCRMNRTWPSFTAACSACLYAPGQIIVGTGVHAQPPSLRLRVDQEVAAA